MGLSFVIGYYSMLGYGYMCLGLENYTNMVQIHQQRPDTDFCYSVAELGQWYNNETVMGNRAKHFAWGQQLEEDLRAAGEPVCYCRRYFVRDLQPGMVYTGKIAYVGPVTGSVAIATAQIPRSRVDDILAGKVGQLLMDPKDVPPEYLVSASTLRRRFTKAKSDVTPTDALVVVMELEKDFPLRLNKAQDMVSFDYEDAPREWVNASDISWFDWKSTYYHVTWSDLYFAKKAGVGREIIAAVWENGFDYREPAKSNPWQLQSPAKHLAAVPEEDPYVPLVEVCGEYTPFSPDPRLSAWRSYNFMISESPLGLPDYSFGVVTVLSLFFGFGQLLFFSPWF